MTTLKSNLLKKGKKGFTLTELAIVIAVIAILIAVLVPTFTSVITNAKKTTAAEDATQAITAYTLETQTSLPDGSIVVVTSSGINYYFVVIGGAAVSVEDSAAASFSATTIVSDLNSSYQGNSSTCSITTYTTGSYSYGSSSYSWSTDGDYSATFTGKVAIYIWSD